MNTLLLSQKTWIALSILGMEYALLGWYLAAHHVFWLISSFIVVTTIIVTWKSNSVLRSLILLVKQPLFIFISVSLLFSLMVALTLVKPILFNLVLLPLITLLYALLEMQAANFKQIDMFFWTVLMTGFCLGLGEAIDLFISPSMRY